MTQERRSWGKCVEILAVQLLLDGAEGFTEPLEVYDFPGAKETDWVRYLRIFYEAKNIVIRFSGFLFRSQVFEQIGQRVSAGLEFTGVKRHSSGAWGQIPTV